MSRQAIIADFNAVTARLLSNMEKKAKTEIDISNLDRLRRRLTYIRQTCEPDFLLSVSINFFSIYKDRIIDPDADRREAFFTTVDAREEYMKYNTGIEREHEFMFELFRSMQQHYRISNVAERADVYQSVLTMLQKCIEYVKSS